ADLDPCGAQPQPTANSVWQFDLAGHQLGQWKLPSFAADLALDEGSGQLLLSFPLMGAVGAVSPGAAAGAVTPRMLFTGSICPSALHATGGGVFGVTAGPGGTPPGPAPARGGPPSLLQALPLTGSAPSPDNFDFPQPQYEAQVNESDSRDGKVA